MRCRSHVKDGNHGTVVARAEFALDDAGPRARRERFTREEIVQTPADISLLQIAPRRPPREEIGVVRIELAMHVDEAVAEDPFDERAFVGALTDDARLSFLG